MTSNPSSPTTRDTSRPSDLVPVFSCSPRFSRSAITSRFATGDNSENRICLNNSTAVNGWYSISARVLPLTRETHLRLLPKHLLHVVMPVHHRVHPVGGTLAREPRRRLHLQRRLFTDHA